MEPRARGAIALYEAWDNDANFHLDTKKVVKRYKLTVLPVPDIVISYLNGLHDKEYNVDNAEHQSEPLLEFRIGQRVIDDTTGYVDDYDPEKVYEVNLNKATDEYAKINRGAENYDPMENK